MADRVFQGIRNNIIDQDDTRYEKVIERWAEFIIQQHRKRLIPLFITGLGVSKDEGNEIPDIYGIIDELKKEFGKVEAYKQNHPEIKELFERLEASRDSEKKDRGTIARLLKAFQETDDLKKNITKQYEDLEQKQFVLSNQETRLFPAQRPFRLQHIRISGDM